MGLILRYHPESSLDVNTRNFGYLPGYHSRRYIQVPLPESQDYMGEELDNLGKALRFAKEHATGSEIDVSLKEVDGQIEAKISLQNWRIANPYSRKVVPSTVFRYGHLMYPVGKRYNFEVSFKRERIFPMFDWIEDPEQLPSPKEKGRWRVE
jgi:hypothetical protein